MKIESYKDLIVWQKGIDISDAVFAITEKFDNRQFYGIGLHLQKTSVSISSNIAEGKTRKHIKEYRHFLDIALGSCAELETQVIIAEKRKYISEEAANSLLETTNHEYCMLLKLIKNLGG